MAVDPTENRPRTQSIDPLHEEDSRDRRAEAAAEARDNRRYLLLFPAVAAVLIIVALVAYWYLA